MLTKCCCVISLKGGTIIAGIVELILTFIAIIVVMYKIVSGVGQRAAQPILSSLCEVCMTITVVALMLYATKNDEWWYLLPWLLHTSVVISYAFLLITIETMKESALFAVGYLFIGLFAYFWCVVYSYWKEQKHRFFHKYSTSQHNSMTHI